jgi:hypothetical protein
VKARCTIGSSKTTHPPKNDKHKEKTTMRLINRIPHSTKPMLLVAVLMAICTLTVSTNAQSAWVAQFTLPYEVQWNHAVLPAGQYTITVDSMSGSAVVRVSSADGRRSIYTEVPIIADAEKGGARVLISTAGGQHTVRSMNLPLRGFSLVFQPLTRTEREELAKTGQLESVPLMTAKK